MRKGEQFVMGEVRARARERIRWSASLGLLAVALLFAPIAMVGERGENRRQSGAASSASDVPSGS
jgi:hypothetical protein